MFCKVIKGLARFKAVAVKFAKYVLDRVEQTARRLWRSHSHRMKTDAGYAAAAAVVLASCFGTVPAKEAAAAVLAMLLGIAMSNGHSFGRTSNDQEVWDTAPDWDADPDFA